MRKLRMMKFVLAAALPGGALLSLSCRKAPAESPPGASPDAPESIHLQSSTFQDGATLPVEYSCSGAGKSPPLAWSGVPQTAKTLALLVTDPDAPGGVWTHWMVWNLPPATTSLPAAVPSQATLSSGARQGKNSRGSIGYDAPCPPPGRPHRYVFTLYALDAKMDLSGVAVDEYSAALRGHVLARGRIMGRFGRQ